MLFFIHKGTVNKSVKNLTQEEITSYLKSGWEEGKCKAHWITNGLQNKLLKEGLELPDGFSYGQSEEFKQKNSLGNRLRWKNMTEEDYQRLSCKISNSIKDMWNNLPEDDKQKRTDKRLKTRSEWTEEQKILFHNKMSTSAISHRKTVSKEKYKEIANKGMVTRKLNNTTNSSSW